MDFSDPSLMVSGLIISMIGLAIFVYGKKAQNIKGIAVGLVMMIFPMFVHSLVWMWLIGGACVAGLYLLPSEA